MNNLNGFSLGVIYWINWLTLVNHLSVLKHVSSDVWLTLYVRFYQSFKILKALVWKKSGWLLFIMQVFSCKYFGVFWSNSFKGHLRTTASVILSDTIQINIEWIAFKLLIKFSRILDDYINVIILSKLSFL